jgi:hypothetical protein
MKFNEDELYIKIVKLNKIYIVTKSFFILNYLEYKFFVFIS